MNQTRHDELVPVRDFDRDIELDDIAKYVQASGYMPNSTHCPIMARKFPGERKGILLKTMLDCDGGGLASHCHHPRKAKLTPTG